MSNLITIWSHTQSTTKIFHLTRVRLTNRNQVIYLQNHSYTLRRQGNLRCVHQQGLNNLLLPHVSDSTISNVDSTSRLTLVVSVSQLGHHTNGVDTRVLGQSIRNNLKSLRITIHKPKPYFHSHKLTSANALAQ